MKMGSSVIVYHFTDWSKEPSADNPVQGKALSIVESNPVLQLTHVDTEIGGHVVGTIQVNMMEITYDLEY